MSTILTLKFDELFDPATVTDNRTIGESYTKAIKQQYGNTVKHQITGFVHQQRTGGKYVASFYAMPTKRLVEMTAERLLFLDHDSIYFQTLIHDDVVAVYARNNLILNSGPPIAHVNLIDYPAELMKGNETSS